MNLRRSEVTNLPPREPENKRDEEEFRFEEEDVVGSGVEQSMRNGGVQEDSVAVSLSESNAKPQKTVLSCRIEA